METIKEVTPWLRESGLTKQSQENLADGIVQKVTDGDLNPLEAKVLLRSAESVIKRAMSGIDEYALREADTYGTKSFSYKGVRIDKVNAGVSYDYSGCNDLILKDLEDSLEVLKSAIKERQKFLQGIKGSVTILDEATGEFRTIYPPIKKSTETLKLSFE
jgi:hypothetical protein